MSYLLETLHYATHNYLFGTSILRFRRPSIPTEDGLPALGIGEWAQDKHRILTHYIEASSPARRKAYPESAFIDLYCGPGRAFVKGRVSFEDGSPLIAARVARNKGNPFSHFFINDEDEEFVKACSTRLSKIETKRLAMVGKAEENIDAIIRLIPRKGITIAFVDPFNLVPFTIIEKLAALPKMDIILHISIQDLNRNVFRYVEEKSPILEAFAPGVTDAVKLTTQPKVFQDVCDYWRALVETTGLKIGERFKTITGPRNAPLYWLVIAARHPLADKIWSSIVIAGKQKNLFLLILGGQWQLHQTLNGLNTLGIQ